MMKSIVSVSMATGALAMQDAAPQEKKGCFVRSGDDTNFYQKDAAGNFWDCQVADIIASENKAGGLFGCRKVPQPDGDLTATCVFDNDDARDFATEAGGKLWGCRVLNIAVPLTQDLSGLEQDKVIGNFGCMVLSRPEPADAVKEGSATTTQRAIPTYGQGAWDWQWWLATAGDANSDSAPRTFN